MQTFSAKNFDMEHHGEKLKSITKTKGYNISQLAELFGLTRAAIEKHFKSERLTRKVLKPYSESFGFSLDDFFSGEAIEFANRVAKKSDVSNEDVVTLQRELIEWQRKYISLQSDYLELTKRFFPNAAQLAMALS
ncbi:helix-turn-helix domain-containing protein [Spirosoma endbachense]|uniref:HTH cro/C1-type domain-containing protein n=1 Tax=Spirosoma endbachense TaxID=2666025 RepID=A0A6P1VZP3_9BACT|nr:helix-turn-helix transcriptional regulator [Spirosoma endbachense]QHV97552.1 hypothetical protein GJR95_22210 [Spirosoma endbachense]